MRELFKKKHVIELAQNIDKCNLILKLLAVDYHWFDLSEKEEDFFHVYVVANNEFIEEVYLKGSNNGEIWDLEYEMEKMSRIDSKFSLYKLSLFEKEEFPRAFVLRGLGGREYYDNNFDRNYVIKKGRGGNLIPKGKNYILLKEINVFKVYDKK